MLRASLALLAALLVLPAGSFAHAQSMPERPSRVDTARQSPLTLGYNVQAGHSASFTLRMRQDVETLANLAPAAPSYTLSVPVRLQIQEVEEDGAFTVVRSLGRPALNTTRSLSADDDRRVAAALDGARITETFTAGGDRQRRDISLEADGRPSGILENVIDILALQLPTLPPEALRVGDSWAQSHSLAFQTVASSARGTITAHYTLAGFVTHANREHVLIDIQWTVELEGEAILLNRQRDRQPLIAGASGEGFALLDPSTGLIAQQVGRLGTVLMLGTREVNRRRQAVELTFAID